MKFILSAQSGASHSEEQLNGSFESLRLPGASVRQISGDFGSIISQELQADDCSIWQHNFIIEQPVLLHPYVTESTHMLNYMLSGNVSCDLTGLGRLILQQGYYNLYYVPAQVQQDAWFDTGIYRSVHINLPASSISDLAAEYPSLQPFPGSGINTGDTGIPHEAFKMDYNIRSLIKDILTCDNKGFSRNLFLKARIMDLLLIYVRDLMRQQKDIFGMDERLLLEIRDYLASNLQHPMTIASLARHFGTNQVSLRRNFKSYFKIPIHHFLVKLRMDKARTLLMEELSVHQIAPMIGYADASSFSRAFSAYFGESPSSYRNNPI